MKTLRLKDIILKYYKKTVLKIDEFFVEDSFALIGCSGSGKSNFLKVIAGLEEIESGYIYIGDKECGDKKPKDRGVSLISARTPLFDNRSAYYNLTYPLKKRGLSKSDIAKRATDVLKRCEILPKQQVDKNKFDLNQKVKNLNSSQKTLLIFARALIKNPQLLLLDEPSEIIGDMPLFLQLLKQLDCFFIFATYDFDLALSAAFSFVILKQGDIIFNGDINELKNTDNLYIKKMCLF